MGTKMMLLAGVALAVAGLTAAPASAAVAGGNTTFYFTGTCTDCSGTVAGELTLSNYTYGQSIGSANFVSFHYDGSDLMPAFTIGSSPFSSESGTINDNLPGPEDVHVSTAAFFSSGYYFDAYADGTWDVGTTRFLFPFTLLTLTSYDTGTAGTFSLAPGATAVPEPASLALLGLGVAGIAAVRRRRAA